MNNNEIELLSLLVTRLERLSVDSHWARRASGLRGNILKVLEEYNAGQDISHERVSALTQQTFDILRRAAQEIPDIDEVMKKRETR
jgi:hypothetical protein